MKNAQTVERAPARERISWALYDFANTVFSMNMASLFFVTWIVSDLHRSNTLYATASGIASALVVVSIPFFGAVSDATQRRKPWVVGFTLIACLATAVIAVIGEHWLPLVGEGVITTNGLPSLGANLSLPLIAVLVAYVIANYTYQGAQPFYNAMLPELVPQNEQGRLSGLAAAFGYVGAIVGVLVAFPFFEGSLPLIGQVSDGVLRVVRSLPYSGVGGRVSVFVPTAILFFLFSMPLFIFCRDHHPVKEKATIAWREAFQAVRSTLEETRKHPGSLRFIVTSFVYQDAMGTVVSYMALYAVYAMDFKKGTEASLLLILTLPAVIGSYLIGKVVDRIGPKKTLSMILIAWVILLTSMIAVPSRTAFWIVGALIGFIYGGVSTAERPLLLTLVPAHDAGRFFSLMVLSARAGAIVGPLLLAQTVDHLVPRVGEHVAYRGGAVTIAIAMALALFLLRKVPDRHTASAMPALAA